jgi:ketosteroid isomerase-like protein
MSQDNVNLVKSLYQAFARADVPYIISKLDPQVVWNEAENFVYADRNPYIGPQAVLEGVFGRIGSEWDGFSATPEEVLDAGDTIVSLGRYRGKYKGTGSSVNAQFVHVFKFRGGTVVTFQQYTDTAQFLGAVGRSSSARA